MILLKAEEMLKAWQLYMFICLVMCNMLLV